MNGESLIMWLCDYAGRSKLTALTKKWDQPIIIVMNWVIVLQTAWSSNQLYKYFFHHTPTNLTLQSLLTNITNMSKIYQNSNTQTITEYLFINRGIMMLLFLLNRSISIIMTRQDNQLWSGSLTVAYMKPFPVCTNFRVSSNFQLTHQT